jgi:hypothetical protein
MNILFQVPELIKANNLWSRNAIYSKKSLVIPVNKERYMELVYQKQNHLKKIQKTHQKMIKY